MDVMGIATLFGFLVGGDCDMNGTMLPAIFDIAQFHTAMCPIRVYDPHTSCMDVIFPANPSEYFSSSNPTTTSPT